MCILQRQPPFVKWANQKNCSRYKRPPTMAPQQKSLTDIDKYAESWYGLFGEIYTDVRIVQNAP